MIYKAVCSFIYRSAPDSQYQGILLEHADTVYYVAEENQLAVDDIWRWVKNRQDALPEHFGPLGCIKIYRFQPMPIEAGGFCRTGGNGNFYEWKFDAHPLPEGVHVRIGTEGL